ncbi:MULTISPECIES: ROK family transcriptional regulator [unclassified Meiothermus]|uniref:ROK family transcriptional regulator n=1 Tax=unclassified Meiothermus TaxID=370471 RepID=UPI000D7C6B55|nr:MULTISPECIES: ROK family transcriptional regulator [unclassified Meiothermus]PZA07849.1 ROK family transcriptional regulator [Meiothermus sp. Pnk-1]RYM38847.1 ROK family transcriptional regulator [Meiothermus sp. PNK-Is4]
MSPSRKGDPLEMKRINRRAILEALKASRSLTRAELARRLGLTKSTISSLMDQLLGEGLVAVELTPQQGEGRDKPLLGRPGLGVTLKPLGAVALGAELGVENSVVLAVDWTGAILLREEWSADPQTPLSERLEGLIQVIREGLRRHPEALGLGLALPGVVDARGWLRYAPNLGWRDFSVAEMLQARFSFPIYIENDANSSAAGEVFFTPWQGQLAYLMLGTGLGVGLVHAGTVLRGANGAFGEVGHWLGRSRTRCRCGRLGCLETEVSLRAMLEHYRALGGKAEDFWQVLKLAQGAQRLALEALAELGRALGRLIANLAVAYDPERVVLGGAGAEAWAFLERPLRQALEAHAFLREHQRLEVQPSRFGHLAPAMGAAALVLHSFLASGGLRERPASPVAMR